MIRPRSPGREQLGEFLTGKRRSLRRSAAGLPPHQRRGDTGLSREEIAVLSGVSTSWYTWLEQGRDINVSQQVLAAVSRVLGLSDSEAEHVLALAGWSGSSPQRRLGDMPEHLRRLADAVESPAFIAASDWTIVGWNRAYAWLYPSITTLPAEERNLLWLIYTDPALKDLLPDWERDSRRFLAEFRAESGALLSTPRHRALVERLRLSSADFRAQWAELSVERFSSRRRAFAHPEAGTLEFEHHRLVPSDAADFHLVIYLPVPAA